jgi:cell division septation protein DedD
MIKPLIILFNTFTVFLFSFFFGDNNVTVTGNFPKNMKAATEFIGEIKIDKGSIGGFAKLQLEVPQGFTVKELESKSGNFSFSGNIAKIIWTSMPSESDFTVKFTLSTDQTVSGAKTIASKFSFVNSSNEKSVTEMPPVEIIIGDAPSAEIRTTEPVNTTNTSPAETSSVPATPIETATEIVSNEIKNEDNSAIKCTRSITKESSDNAFNVDVKIKKSIIKGFAKYQEVIPIGYNARAGKVNGSAFSVADGKLKFVWVSLPVDEELNISYILEKTNEASENGKLEKGEFSYLENELSKKVTMPIEVIKEKEIVAITNNNTPVITTEENTQPTENQSTENQPKDNITAGAGDTKTTAATDSKDILSKKEGNVMYSVQIGAFKNAIDAKVLSKKFKLTKSIKSEMAEGYNKFMIDEYAEYKKARDGRENVRQKGCATAFVVAYNGAKRITVQEALMITSQKWFK